MDNSMKLNYSNKKILEFNLNSIDDFSEIEIEKYDILKAFVTPNEINSKELVQNGFVFGDRTLDVSIPLTKIDGLEKFIRLPIIETSDYKNEILNIAQKSFTYDRRFHLTEKCNQDFANIVLEDWVKKLDRVLVCLFKDAPVGFLALKGINEKALFVHLAAVDEKYRMTGAAMALYAKAILYAKSKGYSSLDGRISSQNTAVMNLYSYFGAKFSNPTDIYIREVR